MKRWMGILLAALLLTGCAAQDTDDGVLLAPKMAFKAPTQDTTVLSTTQTTIATTTTAPVSTTKKPAQTTRAKTRTARPTARPTEEKTYPQYIPSDDDPDEPVDTEDLRRKRVQQMVRLMDFDYCTGDTLGEIDENGVWSIYEEQRANLYWRNPSNWTIRSIHVIIMVQDEYGNDYELAFSASNVPPTQMGYAYRYAGDSIYDGQWVRLPVADWTKLNGKQTPLTCMYTYTPARWSGAEFMQKSVIAQWDKMKIPLDQYAKRENTALIMSCPLPSDIRLSTYPRVQYITITFDNGTGDPYSVYFDGSDCYYAFW